MKYLICLCLSMFLIISLEAQYSTDSLSQIILDVRKIEKIIFRKDKEEFKSTAKKAIELGNDKDYKLMCDDLNNYIHYIGYKAIYEKELKNYEPVFLHDSSITEWRIVKSRITVELFDERKAISYYSKLGGYGTFMDFKLKELEGLMESNYPIIKYLALRAFILHKNELAPGDKLNKLKDYIRRICKDERYIYIHEGCLSGASKLPFAIYQMVKNKVENNNVSWKEFFEKENINLERE